MYLGTVYVLIYICIFYWEKSVSKFFDHFLTRLVEVLAIRLQGFILEVNLLSGSY